MGEHRLKADGRRVFREAATLPRSAALIPITRSTERTGTPSSATLGQAQVSLLL